MGYSVQNSETGEVDIIRCDHFNVEHQEFDEETGEPLNGNVKVRYAKLKGFQIPKKYLRATACDEFDKDITGDYNESYKPNSVMVKPRAEHAMQYHRDDYINMEGVDNKIISRFSKDNYHIFLLPTLFCFNIYLAFFIGLIETFLHYWSHRKNGLNMNKEIYYRSPLHTLTSKFCFTCRADIEVEIFDMLNKQMRLARQSEMLKDVTKAIN